MGEIINFPSKSVRDWATIERAMNETLSSQSVSSAFHARLVERMKSFYETMQIDFNFTIDAAFPSTISRDQVTAICSEIGEKIGVASTEKLQAFTYKLFFDRLAVEVDLCHALNI
jgi:vacuolar-type H+-ATPase catalytic subunit A/Vma1